ncbi:AMP-binding enzyme/acyltransferase [Plesiocystis pacifica SIR-1]|uniref:AMP-binding enzyme/acyltransferase n=1 Tax=Plesiocystis pacifica SIR-1 TaxID=391625 RepID=A6G495_9BACT|nr:lysophospholipid acyltransferase family protein [Plesiocystis pacifica]EDM79207.1 AMP-binding enzyme/acyltransferase [Plesiocystis pacifica SIR-1]
MRRKRLPHREPTEDNKVWIERVTQRALGPSRAALMGVAPLSWSGRETLPDEPVLILSNHVSLFDPWFTITAAGKPIHYLATAAAMQQPVMGFVLRTWGSVPKRKFTVDAGAIRALKKWADLGASVGSYPEGERSWDGELLPLLPGIEALVRLLKLPVVPVRILNADRVLPRWASVRRHGRVEIQFGEARKFPRKAPPAEVRAWLEQSLRIDQRDEANHFPVRGVRLALGIENPLFRCPHCFAWDALSPQRNVASCMRCGASWRVNTHNELLAEGGGASSMTIVEARARIREATADNFFVNEHRFEREGLVAESQRAPLLNISGDQAEPMGMVRARLTREAVAFIDDAGRPRLTIPLRELMVASVELRRRLTFRTESELYELVLPTESPLKWRELTEHWRERAHAGDEA